MRGARRPGAADVTGDAAPTSGSAFSGGDDGSEICKTRGLRAGGSAGAELVAAKVLGVGRFGAKRASAASRALVPR
jgi:hypothetical protein